MQKKYYLITFNLFFYAKMGLKLLVLNVFTVSKIGYKVITSLLCYKENRS